MGKKAGETDGTGKERKTGSVSETKAGESFCVDAITWNDLDLDAVFDTVDHTVSVCGEEYLYTALRMPVTTTEIREERERLMKLFAENQKAREAVQKALLLMGKEKMNPPTRRNSRTDGGGAGREGKISSDGRYCCAWNWTAVCTASAGCGCSVCFYGRQRTDAWKGEQKAGECIKSVWLYPAAAADSQGTWKRKKFPDWKCIRSVWKNRKNNSVRLQENAEHL